MESLKNKLTEEQFKAVWHEHFQFDLFNCDYGASLQQAQDSGLVKITKSAKEKFEEAYKNAHLTLSNTVPVAEYVSLYNLALEAIAEAESREG